MRVLLFVLCLLCSIAHAGPTLDSSGPGRHRGRVPPTVFLSTEDVILTGSDIQIAQMRAAEPTTVLSSQTSFRVASWNQVDYDEAGMLRPCVAPCSGGNLLPASLQGATIVAVRIELYRSVGFFDTTTTFYASQILRTDVAPATMTWDERATGSAWQAGGAQGASDKGAVMTSVVKSTHAFETYTFATSAALVSWMQALANGAQTQPWVLIYPSASAGTYNTFHGPTGANPIRIIVTKEVS
jgi:hypothetical protein